jgi:hypothetical protein
LWTSSKKEHRPSDSRNESVSPKLAQPSIQTQPKLKGKKIMSESRNSFVAFVFFFALFILAPIASYAQVGKPPSQTATTSSVKGSGTPGRITKWAGTSSPSVDVSDSIITESSTGLIGIGMTTPTSKLTVAGTIQTTAGGVKFPDGTLQTTAALASVSHNATLTGDGSGASPLGIADGGVGTTHLANNSVIAAKIASGQVVKSLNGLTDNVTFAAGSGITLTPVGNTVTIASTATDPAQNAFQSFISFTPTDTGGFAGANVVVPAGKRLVREYLTLRVFGDGECQPMEVITTVAGVPVQHAIQLPEDEHGFARAIDKQVRIYADSDIRFQAISRSGSTKRVDITVSGFLVDLP